MKYPKFLYRAEEEILKVFCLNVEKDSIAAISFPPAVTSARPYHTPVPDYILRLKIPRL
jgi:hypothetical protein